MAVREIFDHVVEGDPAPQLKIEVMDEPGAGGACHNYAIYGFESPAYSLFVRSCLKFEEERAGTPVIQSQVFIPFQNGLINEAGVNGLTNESLLVIVIDRLRSFQAGPYPCQDNRDALDFCELALECLKDRTRDRLEREVEGERKP